MRFFAIIGFIIISNASAFLNGQFPTKLLHNQAHMTASEASSNDDTPSSSRPKSFHTYLSDLFNTMDVDSFQTRNFIPTTGIPTGNKQVEVDDQDRIESEKYLKLVDKLHLGNIFFDFITMTPLCARDLFSTIIGSLSGYSKLFIPKTKLTLLFDQMQLVGYTFESVDESIEGNTYHPIDYRTVAYYTVYYTILYRYTILHNIVYYIVYYSVYILCRIEYYSVYILYRILYYIVCILYRIEYYSVCILCRILLYSLQYYTICYTAVYTIYHYYIPLL